MSRSAQNKHWACGASLSGSLQVSISPRILPSLEKPTGRKRDQLEAWFAGPEGPSALFAGRVLPFDEKAGLIWARLMSEGTAAGRPRCALDTIIAAVAESNGCTIVTDNEKHFTEIDTINPLRESS